MATKRVSGPARTITFRLPDELIERLDWYAKRLADLTGLDVSRTDALKHAVGRGLKQAVKEFRAVDQVSDPAAIVRARERKEHDQYWAYEGLRLAELAEANEKKSNKKDSKSRK